MKNKAQALILELELLELEAEKEEYDEAFKKNDTQRRAGLIIMLTSLFLPIIVVLLFRTFIAPMILLFVFLFPFGVFLHGGSERFKLKQKMKENRAKVREVKKSLLHLKYEE